MPPAGSLLEYAGAVGFVAVEEGDVPPASRLFFEAPEQEAAAVLLVVFPTGKACSASRSPRLGRAKAKTQNSRTSPLNTPTPLCRDPP